MSAQDALKLVSLAEIGMEYQRQMRAQGFEVVALRPGEAAANVCGKIVTGPVTINVTLDASEP